MSHCVPGCAFLVISYWRRSPELEASLKPVLCRGGLCVEGRSILCPWPGTLMPVRVRGAPPVPDSPGQPSWALTRFLDSVDSALGGPSLVRAPAFPTAWCRSGAARSAAAKPGRAWW